MKSIFVLGVIFTVICNPIQTSAYEILIDNRFSQNAVIYQLFEMLRDLIKLGDVEKYIPIMDPYTFNARKAHFHTLVDCEVNITSGAISGLSTFRIEDFAFTKEEIALDVIINIPMIKFDAEYYEMKGEILEALPLEGSGILYFLAKDLTIKSKLYLKQSDNGKSVIIDKLENTSFTIKDISSRTEYDKNIDDVLNAMTEDLLAGYLTRFNKFIAKTCEDYVVITLNSILNKFKTWSILATILH